MLRTPQNNAEIVQQITEQSRQSVEVVSLSEAKSFLNLDSDFTADDGLLNILIDSAVEELEKYSALAFMPVTYVVTYTGFGKVIDPPYKPFVSLGALQYIKDNNELLTVNPSHYDVINKKIFFKGYKYPFYNKLQMTYTAGYASGEIPKIAKLAVLQAVNEWYENRGDLEVELPSLARNTIKKLSIDVLL